jgi:transposase
LSTKINAVVDQQGMPVRIVLSQGQSSDKTIAPTLVEGLKPDRDLVADPGHDARVIIDLVEARGERASIFSKLVADGLDLVEARRGRARSCRSSSRTGSILPKLVADGLDLAEARRGRARSCRSSSRTASILSKLVANGLDLVEARRGRPRSCRSSSRTASILSKLVADGRTSTFRDRKVQTLGRSRDGGNFFPV